MLAGSKLLSLTLDAHRFLLCNRGLVQTAPLQAYVSALLFTPTRSLTHQLFQREEPNWVIAGPVEEHWNSLVKTLTGHGGSVNSVTFSPDSKLVASSSDETIKIWDMATGESKHTLMGHSGWVNSVAFSPNGKLVASGSGDETIKIWDTATGKLKHTLTGHSG
jgi:WD40 repeat protein